MSKKEENFEEALKNIAELIKSIKYGSITIIVQDEHVVQIERNEKIRLK